MCVAIDSQMMVQFQRERILEQPSIGMECLQRILRTTYLALDDGDHCVSEYYQTLSGMLGEEMRTWITQAINDNKLRILPFGDFRQSLRRIAQAGLPNRDHRWIKLCSHPCVTHLLTEDIDFYDPRAKQGNQAAKRRAKIERRGSMLALIEQCLSVTVFCPDHLDHYFPAC